MKQALAVLLAVTLSLGGEVWASEVLPLLIPSKTGLKLAKLQKREHVASFLGTVDVVGRLVAQWVPEVDETIPTNQEFRIYVDESMALMLPAFGGHPVRTIDIVNGNETLRKAVSPQEFESFARKKTMLVELTAVFRIKSYVVGVECDAQWAHGIVTNVMRPELLASTKEPIRVGC